MASTIRSYSARDRGKLARLKCAGAPWYGGLVPSFRVSSGCSSCAIALTAAGGGGILAVPSKAFTGLDLGTQGGEVVVPLADGP